MGPDFGGQDPGIQDTVVDRRATPDGAGPSLAAVGNVLWPPRLIKPAFLIELVFLATRFPVGLFWFVTLVTMISLGLGTVIVIMGFGVLAVLVLLTRFGAVLERQLIGFVDGRAIESPYRRSGKAAGALSRIKNVVTDPATYRDVLYLFLQFPAGLTTFVGLAVLLFVPVFLVILPVVMVVNADSFDVEIWSGWLVIDTLFESVIAAAVGLGLLLVTPFALSGLTAIHVWLARGLLGPTTSARLNRVEDQRRRGVSASVGERKRIERDLHDGAQQQLVSVAMNLGRAQAKFDDDPDKARELLDSAKEQTKTAITELRNLARGIMPAVLTDRGLDAALSALAEQSPVEVRINNDLRRRLPESVESTAYFVVSEALTNAAKHGGPNVAVTVDVRDAGEVLHLQVADNGPGGADPEGRGLVGLSDRVVSIGGWFWVSDGVVPGTVIRAELPCGS